MAVAWFDAAVPLVLLCADVGFVTEPLFGIWRRRSDDSDRTDPARWSSDEAQVLEYNEDPTYLRDLLVYRLTVEAKQRVEESGLSRRELARRLNTSVPQLYRLLDTTKARKSMNQLVSLLQVLDCSVDLVVADKEAVA